MSIHLADGMDNLLFAQVVAVLLYKIDGFLARLAKVVERGRDGGEFACGMNPLGSIALAAAVASDPSNGFIEGQIGLRGIRFGHAEAVKHAAFSYAEVFGDLQY